MSDNSARLNLPYIAPNQAQKHVTHNEAIQMLDAVTQLSVQQIDAANPPVDPEAGQIYALGAAPTGVWAGAAGQLAYFSDSGWLFLEPQAGWRAWDAQTSTLYVYSSAQWQSVVASSQNTPGLGIQSSWDDTNRLSVASAATLFTHLGAGHQLKINKSDASETASVLFQSNFTGHAEFGLSGETAFSMKISADGGTWQTALRLDPTSGEIEASLPITGPAVQTAATDVTPGRLMRADYGYGPGNLLGSVGQSGGVPTGAVIERGSTATGHYTRWADGTQMCWAEVSVVFDQNARLVGDWVFPATFAPASVPAISATLQTETGVAPQGAEILAPVGGEGSMPRNEGCELRVYRVSGGTDYASTDTLPVNAVAIGRWI